ncbi:hypothetical protein LMH87_010970 [Akanthomyces muscarius]|uniref:TIGR02453 family protein n=1 Tax=Akanthomyces muscarius TaxID=2231603 RepID=A0A9W8Q9Q4_AKAMU|nr:hypothetical protein LMH87_010970 [Akanthomyces muscarius]KAJ4150211.1 hypothetical protein LMH87_010970 [Akanthomyces muscarius]
MPARKRAAENAVTEDARSSRRRSGRVSNTPKKSSYWEGSDDEENESDDEKPVKKRARVSNGGRSASAVKKKQKEESDEDEYTAEAQLAAEAEEDDDDDDEEADEDDENRQMKVTIVPLEQMRDEGGVPYEDHKVHKNTMLFLKDLKANNRRPWLKSHDGEYRRAFKDWQTFVDATTQTVASFDATVPELPSKDVVFRIYRDTRFSKDPTPYKPHFSAAWSRTGRKGPYACYYIHVEPGGRSFVGGGLWHPEAGHVHKMRRSIDRHPERWRAVLGDETFRRVFFPQVKKTAGGAEAVVKAFVGKNQMNALKKKPMGYDVTHRDIALLKLKNYTVGTSIDEDILCRDDAQEKIGEYIRAMEGYITFVNSIVMPDPGLDESDSDEDEDEDEEENDD